VNKIEEPRYRELMQQYHDLGTLAKIGHTLWYAATYGEEWVALVSFSAAAWKCGVRDRWIGWDFRHQHGRLPLIANTCLALTRGYRRTRDGYSTTATSPKLLFILPVQRDAQAQLSHFTLNPIYRSGAPKIMLTAQQMRTLPDFFNDIPDPRRAEGKRHRLSVVLGIAAGATLCGMRGYKAIAAWAKDLKPKARERFGCRRENKQYTVPSESIIRDVLVRVDPVKLDLALQQWNAAFATEDQSLAIDGKTMCNAVDEAGRQTHIMSVVGHETALCITQKKSVPCP
jgi:hypothetical protein